MKKLLGLLALFSVTALCADTRHFELRVYENNRGKLNGTIERFRNDIVRLFEKHGLDPLGFWTGKNENGTDLFVYLLASPDKESFEKSTVKFGEDPEFKAAFAGSTEKHGNTVRRIESYPLQAVDWAGKFSPASKDPARTFELRIYNIRAGKMEPYLESYQKDRLRLFEKHGLENMGFWTVKGQDKFVMLVAGKNRGAIERAKDDYHADPEWKKAMRALEPLGQMTGDVITVILTPVDFSRTK